MLVFLLTERIISFIKTNLMEVFINTDKNIDNQERTESYFANQIKEGLARFEDRVTRVEVHLSDENGTRKGPNDKKCVFEVRPEGLKPIAVVHHDNSIEKAIRGATKKAISSLNSLMGKLQSH